MKRSHNDYSAGEVINRSGVMRLDSAESTFLERQLDSIKTQTYDVKFAELKARKLIPVSSEADEGAERIFYRQYNQSGFAKIMHNYASDSPRADVIAAEFSTVVQSLGASYGYNIQELRAAVYSNVPLEQRKANAARRSIAQLENKLAFFGDEEACLQGFFTGQNIPVAILPADGAGNSVLWTSKTPEQIIRDLNLIANSVAEQSLGVEIADTLLMPLESYNLISSTPRSANSDTTILNYFLQNNPYIKEVEWVNELKGAGAGATKRMVAYRRDPEVLTMEVPMDFQQLELERRGREFVIECDERFAGVLIYYPLAIAFADGF